ncbi:MAG: transposase [Actinomycetota bacterium]|nr:transposase [Actinomycetota bacterium]
MPGGFDRDDFRVDHARRTVTCPNGETVPVSANGNVTFGRRCHGCPLRARCTTSRTGRRVHVGAHDRQLVAARAAAKTGKFQADYRWRPMVERSISWLVRDGFGWWTCDGRHRRCRYRGIKRNQLGLSLHVAAVNLQCLLALGLDYNNAEIRSELGYGADERVCIVTVGGSGVGGHLLRRVIDAFPEAKRHIPELRMIVVAGPRIDPASLPSRPGLEVRPYVHELYRHLAVCDLAVVQGGLTTTMELTATNRPFISIPLRHHFEQNFHVAHRLQRYGAGRRMNYEDTAPDALAQAIREGMNREVRYQPVATDGAARAAALLADLV